MQLFGKKYYIDGSKVYLFFGIPFLFKKRTPAAIRTYIFGIRTSKRMLVPAAETGPDWLDCIARNKTLLIYGPAIPADADIDSDAEAVRRGLDDETREKWNRIIRRLKTLTELVAAGKTDADFADFFEASEIKDIKRRLKVLSEIKSQNGIFEYNNYKQHWNYFEPSIFTDEYEIDRLGSAAKIRGDKKLAVFDIGACNGDSSLILARAFPNNPVYAVESVGPLCDKISEIAALNDVRNIIPVNLAMSDKSGGTMKCEYGAHASETQIDTLDNFVRQNKIKVGLIKTDIEGAEWAFLHGALETIRKQKPTLIISIYHNYNDLMRIKPLIESLNLGYKFAITDSNYGMHPIHEITLNAWVE
ncbi:MAG: FkbM family methyltransferase [Alphaproteobacteria bacterium]|nr:FkbM family methyltransferase [Alphaproteobacteria bacterium]